MKSSIRRRLLVTLLATMVAVWSAVTWIGYSKANHEVEELFDGQLAQSARVLMALVSRSVESGELDRLQDLVLHNEISSHEASFSEQIRKRKWAKYERNVAFQVWDAAGRLRLRSSSAPLEPLANNAAGFQNTTVSGQDWRVFNLANPDRSLVIRAAERFDVREETARYIVRSMMRPALAGLPLLGLFIWFGVGRGLKPLRAIAGEVARRRPGDLSPVDAAGAPAEVAGLVTALNDLFERLSQAFDSERRFTGDAAHELRTPLAALKVQAQVALGADRDKPRRRALRQVLAGVDQASRLVDQLLTLARLDHESETAAREPVPVHQLAGEILAELAPVIGDKDIRVSFRGDPKDSIFGDPNVLRILLRNLLDNAFRYSPAGGLVEFATRTESDAMVVTVTDSGPGIPAARREDVMRRFFRLREQHTPGSGLGLSIAQRIADLHHARLHLDEAPGGTGLRVTVSFPAAPA